MNRISLKIHVIREKYTLVRFLSYVNKKLTKFEKFVSIFRG